MPQTYTRTQRLLHWLTAVFIAALVMLGLWMKERSGANIWDALTNTLYAWHKLIGFLVLLLTAHGVLYLLLLAVPLLGWAGVTAYPALITVGGYNLPAMPGIPQDQALAKQLFEIHGNLALLLAVLALGHLTAALYHLVIKKDGVFQRMWCQRGNPKG